MGASGQVEASPNKASPSPSSGSAMAESCHAMAQRLAGQEAPRVRAEQWGVLTPLSAKARQRAAGGAAPPHIALYAAEHVLGRVVPDGSYAFDSPAVSARHCTIARGHSVRDSSSNGTYVNGEKLKRNGPEVRLRHGDLVSLVALPEHKDAFAFVFREVVGDGGEGGAKRKEADGERESGGGGAGKRVRAAEGDGPVSLADVRRLQRSNEELRQQLEANVLEIERLRGEYRDAEALHRGEVDGVRAAAAAAHAAQLEEARAALARKVAEGEESAAVCAQQRAAVEDLNHRLASAAQSRADAEEAIVRHAGSVAELKRRVEEEFGLRQKERAEWEASLEAAVERARAEAAEELRRHSEAAARVQKQQQDVIAELQEADREGRALADGLRVKLEAERQEVVGAEERGRRMGVQLQEERAAAEAARKRAAELEEEVGRMGREVETEVASKDLARARVAALELEKEAASRDLKLEKQRLQGARERIVLRETQLRAFYATAAEVEALQQKQQKQLKLMLSALEEDGEGRDYAQSSRRKAPRADESAGTEPNSPSSPAVKGDGAAGFRRENGVNLGHENGGTKVPDQMDGDTEEQMEEDPFPEHNSPGGVSPPADGADGADTTRVIQDTFVEEDDAGAKGVNSNPDNDTQILPEMYVAGFTTQLIHSDTLQVLVGSSEGENLLADSAGLRGRSSGQRSNLGRSGESPDGHGRQRPEVGDHRVGGSSLQPENLESRNLIESVGTGIDGGYEQEPRAPDSLPTADVVTGMRHYEETQVERGESGKAATMCTDDLLTSEVAGSWALGTQASVHTGNEAGTSRGISRRRTSAPRDDTHMDQRENTLCTEDLLASEVAGSWAAGTPASVHADNDSLSSDERNPPGPDEGGSQAAAVSHPQRSLFRPGPRHLPLDEVMHFADPINSQNSLSPATTYPARSEREEVDEMLDIVEPGFGGPPGSVTVRRPQSDVDDSTTDDDDDGSPGLRTSADDGSQPMNQSVSVR